MDTETQSEANVAEAVVPVAAMRRLKYYIHDHSQSFRLQLLGYLTASDLPELEGCWQTAKPSVAGRKVKLDLRGLTGADAAGQQWLAGMTGNKDVEVLVSIECSNHVIPGGNVAIGRGGNRGSCWDRLRVMLRTGRRASVSQEPVEAAVQTVP